MKDRTKRPTVDAVMEHARVSHGTAVTAFDELEASGVDLGERSSRGRPRQTTNSQVDYSSEAGAGSIPVGYSSGACLVVLCRTAQNQRVMRTKRPPWTTSHQPMTLPNGSARPRNRPVTPVAIPAAPGRYRTVESETPCETLRYASGGRVSGPIGGVSQRNVSATVSV